VKALALISAALALLPLPTLAAQVRPVNEGEFQALLLGCWAGQDEICFGNDGTLITKVFIDAPDGAYGYDEAGTYVLRNDKLMLHGKYSCDATIQPLTRLMLSNCAEGELATPSYDGEFRYLLPREMIE